MRETLTGVGVFLCAVTCGVLIITPAMLAFAFVGNGAGLTALAITAPATALLVCRSDRILSRVLGGRR